MTQKLPMPDKWKRAAIAASVIVFCISLTAGLSSGAGAQSTREAVIVSINDVYRLKGVNEGRLGGMARVRALRAELEREAPDLLLLHAGDFLSPSFLGRTFKGRQMIDLMNVMDGNPAVGAQDPRMFVVFGNHEFDDTHCRKNGPLADLVSASEFTWLASNLDFSACEKLSGLAGHKRIKPAQIIESGGLRIGLFGVTLARRGYQEIVADPIEAACHQIAALRAAGADVVVALTHLNWRADLELLGARPGGTPLPAGKRRCAEAPDLIIGGHDHNNLALPATAPRLFKADADAVTAWVIRITKGGDGAIKIDATLRTLDETVVPDAFVDRLAAQWTLRHDEQFCTRACLGQRGKPLKACLAKVPLGACLKEPIARTNSLIETEEIRNRSFETGFGDWVADRVRDIGKADVAFLNAGGFRLNEDIAAGTMIRRRHLAQLFPFANKIVVREVAGSVLWQAMETALLKRGEGGWAHFSGMAVRLQIVGGRQRLQRILVRRADGSTLEVGPDSKDTVSIASVSFVLANGDRHGFNLCPDLTDIWACKDRLEEKTNWPLDDMGADLPGFVEQQLRALGGENGLTLATDRRLCDPGDTDCLIDRW